MSSLTTAQLTETKRALTLRLIQAEVITTCLNCNDFAEGTEVCLRHHVRPPAAVIASGCEDWLPDVPF
jgi:hypothetical protein